MDPQEQEGIESFISEELAAVEAYRVVIDRVQDASVRERLRVIQRDHDEAARLLQERSVGAPRIVVNSSGGWAGWSRSIAEATRLFGEKIALKALKVAEEHGACDYEAALRDVSLDARLALLIDKRLLPKTRAHIPVLERFIEPQGARAERTR